LEGVLPSFSPSPVMKPFATLRSAAALGLFAALPAIAQPAPPVIVWEQPAGALTLAFSPNGQYVVSGGAQGLNPDSSHVIGRVDVFAAADGALLAHAVAHAGGVPIGFVNAVAFSPDGARLASAHGTAGYVEQQGWFEDYPGLFTWTVPTLTPVAAVDTIRRATAVAYHPLGGPMAVGLGPINGPAPPTLPRYDPVTLAPVDSLFGHYSGTAALAYASDGQRIVSVGGEEDFVSRVRMWDTQTGDSLWASVHGDYIEGGDPRSLTFSPNGALVASAGTGVDLRAKVWDASTGALVLDLDANVDTVSSNGEVVVAFTPNGAYLLAGIHENMELPPFQRTVLRFWDVATGAVAAEYEEEDAGERITALAFSPAQNHRFAYVVGGTVKLAETTLDLSGGTPTTSGDGPLPEGFVLSAVYPNPFNPQASFTLDVARAQAARVALYDALGREVAVLHDGPLAARATHRFTLDGSGLPSGAYVVRVVGETFTAARRVTLLR